MSRVFWFTQAGTDQKELYVTNVRRRRRVDRFLQLFSVDYVT